jgi:hypothetical protein
LQDKLFARSAEGQRLRLSMLRGSVIAFVTAGYSGKRFIFEKCRCAATGVPEWGSMYGRLCKVVVFVTATYSGRLQRQALHLRKVQVRCYCVPEWGLFLDAIHTQCAALMQLLLQATAASASSLKSVGALRQQQPIVQQQHQQQHISQPKKQQNLRCAAASTACKGAQSYRITHGCM